MAELRTYEAKRDFAKTAEPRPAMGKRTKDSKLGFVIQKHDASRLHYDFRLEMEGVLRSWAVPKGPSLDTKDKRLAMEAEDHPIAYGSFEGTIPQGEYGGGTVLLWDEGTWIPDGDPVEMYRKGHIKFRLEGKKLQGSWHLVKTRGRERSDKGRSWLLFKGHDEFARAGGTVDSIDEASVKTGRSLAQIADVASMPSVIEPQLCRLVEEPPKGTAWIHEPKIDGYRVMIRKEGRDVRLFTRGGLDWTESFPEVRDAVDALPVHSVILDGEVAVLENGNPKFEALQRALSTDGKTTDMVCFVFDCLYLEGEDLRQQPLIARKQVMAALLDEQPKRTRDVLLAVPHVDGDGAKAFSDAQRKGLEGIVSKLRDAPYTSGRGEAWLKVKATRREELVVIGYADSDTGPKKIGALLLAARADDGALRFAGKVGTGFTNKMKGELWELLSPLEAPSSPVQPRPSVKGIGKVHWVKPDVVVEVAYGDITRDGILRHASFQGVRLDKRAADVDEPERVKPQKPRKAPARPQTRRATAARARSAAAASEPTTRPPITTTERPGRPQDGPAATTRERSVARPG